MNNNKGAYKKANDTPSYMNTLSACVNKVVLDGYTDTFKVTKTLRLKSVKSELEFNPEEVHIINFYRFEGNSDPADNAIMYVIEAKNQKGILIDAFGAYSDARIAEFIQQVEDIQKKNTGEAASC